MPARIPEEVRIKQINDIVGITLRGWSEPYRGAKTGAFLTCDTCGYGWKSDIFTIVKSKRCPSCIGVARKGMHVRESEINAIRGIKFISWKSWIGGAYSRANVSCDDCGTVWDATVNNLVNKKRGCPGCAPEKISTVKRLSTESIIDRISSVEGVSFIRFVGEYRNARSKVVLRCNACGIEFSTTSGSVVNSGTGCQECSKRGYNNRKPGAMYALRSECGAYIKIGISNKPSSRFESLSKSTPFKFINIEEIWSDDGRVAQELERQFHRKYESAGFSGFDGATEWLVFTNELYEEIVSTRRLYA